MSKKEKDSGYKTLKCKLCTNTVPHTDVNAKYVTCWECTQLGVEGFSETEIRGMDSRERNKIFVK